MKKYYLIEVHKTGDEFTEAVCETREEAIEKARKYWERLFDSDKKNITLEIRYADETWDDVDEEFYPDFADYDTVNWQLTYQIREVETNIVHDEIYENWQDAETAIEEFLDDDETAWDLTFEIIDSDGNVFDSYKKSKVFRGLLSFKDATKIWNLGASTLRMAVAANRLKEGVDVQKFGRDWVVTEEAMKRLYGEPEE